MPEKREASKNLEANHTGILLSILPTSIALSGQIKTALDVKSHSTHCKSINNNKYGASAFLPASTTPWGREFAITENEGSHFLRTSWISPQLTQKTEPWPCKMAPFIPDITNKVEAKIKTHPEKGKNNYIPAWHKRLFTPIGQTLPKNETANSEHNTTKISGKETRKSLAPTSCQSLIIRSQAKAGAHPSRKNNITCDSAWTEEGQSRHYFPMTITNQYNQEYTWHAEIAKN